MNCVESEVDARTELRTVAKEDHRSPAMKEAVDKYFPGAMTGKQAESLVAQELMRRGYNGENTLFADSSCPDEINHDDPGEDITSLFQ